MQLVAGNRWPPQQQHLSFYGYGQSAWNRFRARIWIRHRGCWSTFFCTLVMCLCLVLNLLFLCCIVVGTHIVINDSFCSLLKVDMNRRDFFNTWCGWGLSVSFCGWGLSVSFKRYIQKKTHPQKNNNNCFCVQILPVPEMIPFRLTNQIMSVTSPHQKGGEIYEKMLRCLTTLRNSSDVILPILNVFLHDPSVHWDVSWMKLWWNLGKSEHVGWRDMSLGII